MKLLLIGSNGMLGGALLHVLAASHDVFTFDRNNFDITQANWRELSCDGYDYVINAAGLINRRAADDASFYKVNAIFPHVLSALCARQGARLIHFSTDCVFDGINAPFFEDSPRGARDLYGTTKALGEPNMALVIRTSIIGPEKKNFYNLLCWALSQRHIEGFTNHLWNGVTTIELARIVDLIISKSLYTEGVRHIFSEDCSKYELLKSICDVFSHDARIVKAEAPQPRDTRLRTRFTEFSQTLGVGPMRRQLTALLPVTGSNGHWLGQEERAP